ncbi:putative membrane protein [Staphylococcus hominis]
MMIFKPQKLHPISYFTGLIDVIKQNIFVIIVFIGFNIWNFDFTNIRHYIGPGIFLLIILFSMINQFQKVRLTRYWIENDQFIVTSGWLNKKRKELNLNRIQSLDTTQGLLNQLVGGVRLQIKTPSDGIELETISKQQSELIERTIKKRQLQLDSQEIEPDNKPNNSEQELISEDSSNNEVIFKMSNKLLIFMALTSGVIGVAFATISPIIGAFEDVIPWEKWTSRLFQWIQSVTFLVTIIILTVLIFCYVIGTLIVVLRYYNYTITQRDNELKITYGLLNVKNITVPIERLQAVVEKQSFIRKLFGYTSIYFIITSDLEVKSNEDVSENGKIMILPFINKKEAYSIIRKLIPEMQFNAITENVPKRGYHRHFFIPSIILILGATIGAYYWSIWSYMIAIIIIIFMAIYAYVYISASGLCNRKNEIALRQVSMMHINSYYFKKDKIIGMNVNQNPLLEKSHLAHLHFIIAKGAVNEDIKLKYASEKQVQLNIETYLGGSKIE